MNRQRWNRKQQGAVTILKMMLVFPVFIGWSGFLYPDLTFQNGVVEAYSVTDGEEKEMSGQEFYENLLQAKLGQIRVRSRLLEFICKQFSQS